ncbi:unnamed protein product [Cylicocyclus nassatus]|uniref:Uncharacterized protein n=1 Tax=Cylicocyclus nassatus TaxID=53992 RepID=A0AA36MAH1_CYLNA|nr:unnamed protein product [Cylicocyclus nassatus]
MFCEQMCKHGCYAFRQRLTEVRQVRIEVNMGEMLGNGTAQFGVLLAMVIHPLAIAVCFAAVTSLLLASLTNADDQVSHIYRRQLQF